MTEGRPLQRKHPRNLEPVRSISWGVVVLNLESCEKEPCFQGPQRSLR